MVFRSVMSWISGSSLLLSLCTACGGPEGPVVSVYCALDQEHSEAILGEFTRQTGIRVQPSFDNEQTKTVGLMRRIQAEKSHPRCDVFWNNEIVNTIVLKNSDCLQPYVSPSAADIPATFKDPEGYWAGFAARARVFIVNSEKCSAEQRPTTLQDYLDSGRENQWCIAKPIAGTTATHAAVLFHLWGTEEAKSWFERAKANGAAILTSNGQTMRQVRGGQFPYGLTDTDDFNVARLDGYPVEMVYPDQGDGQMGCLVIPNTVSMIRDAPHPEEAKKFIDFVLSKEVERMLAFARSAQIPVRGDVECPPHVTRASDLKVMEVDFGKAAEEYTATLEWMQREFLN
jgi:iron(III) transport system substrate-binding protein